MATPLKIANPDLAQDAYAEALADDLGRLSQAAHTGNFDDIDFPEPGVLLAHLQIIVHDKHPQHPDCRKARHIASILRSYGDALPKDYSGALDKLQEIIGSTPVIEQLPELPADHHFARTLAANREAWKRTPSEKPVRGKKQGQIHFLVKGDRAVVRTVLATSAESDAIKTLTVGDETFFLNLLDFQYYPEALLHADHMESSAELLSRQTELVEAMNLNPRLKDQVMADCGDLGYFMEVDQKIVGTYWFYMAFHNSTANVWHLLASMNSGDKGATSPMAWLGQTQLGHDFLRAKGHEINQSSLFYCLKDGTTLQQAFTSWVKEHRAEAYKTAHTLAREYKATVAAIQTGLGDKQLRDMRFNAAVRMASSNARGGDPEAASADDGTSDNGSFGSVSPSEAAEYYALTAADDPEYSEAMARAEQRKRAMRTQAIEKARAARAARLASKDGGKAAQIPSAANPYPQHGVDGAFDQIPPSIDPAARAKKKPRTDSPPPQPDE